MYDAWETATPGERVRLARRALEISADCADAYVLLAEETARSPKEAATLYARGVAAIWTYGRALHAFRREGDTPESRRLRAEARRWNRHVPPYLSGRKRLPRTLPDLIGMGDESEAIYCAAEQMAAWHATPGALAWLTVSSE